MGDKLRTFLIGATAGMIGVSLGGAIGNSIDKKDDNKKAEWHELTKNDSTIIQMANDPNQKTTKVIQEICAQEGCSLTDMKKHTRLPKGAGKRIKINYALEKHGRNRIVYSKEQKEYLEKQNKMKTEKTISATDSIDK